MIKLDWLGMRIYRNRIIIAVLMACGLGVLLGAWMILPYLIFGMFDSSLYCFDAEEKGKLNQFYLTLPISRGTLIGARYALSLILQLAGIVAGIVLTFACSVIMYGRTIINEHTYRPNAVSLVLNICISLLVCAFLSLTIHPILHKFGYAKARVLGYALPMYGTAVLFVMFIIISNYVEAVGGFVNSVLQWVANNTVWASLIMLCAAALLLAASYALSQRVYAKRDF
jgi:hypothetical protein